MFLAAGNGAALTAIGAKVLDALFGEHKLAAPKSLLKFCLPLMDWFALGLVAAALIPVFELITRLLSKKDVGSMTPDAHWRHLWHWLPELGSAFFFGGGIVTGLLKLQALSH